MVLQETGGADEALDLLTQMSELYCGADEINGPLEELRQRLSHAG